MPQVDDLLIEFKKKILADMVFTPTDAQWPILLDPHRFLLVTGGWRAGKSEISAVRLVMNHLVSMFFENKEAHTPRLYWIIAQDFETCRPEFEKALVYLDRLDLLVKDNKKLPDEGQLVIHLLDGTVIKTKSADNELKIAEEAPDGILVVEAGRLTETAWWRIQGRTMEKRGWCYLSGTLEGSDAKVEQWYADLFWQWQGYDVDGRSYAMPSWSNTVKFPGGRNDPEIKKWEAKLPPDMFQEKFAAIPVKPTGLIMREFSSEIHTGNFLFNPEVPVELAIDPGYGGAYAVEAIQIIESTPYLIDEVYLQGYVTEDIIATCQTRPWWTNVRGGAVDIAATQHQGMSAPAEVWAKVGKVYLESQRISEEGGIEILRRCLRVDPTKFNPQTGKLGCPGIFVDHKCKGFIAECGGGRSPVAGGGPWLRDIHTGRPIDKDNHATKAVTYWLVNKFGYTTFKPNNKLAQSTLVNRRS